MKASIVDLRYKTNEILKALDRNESVEILYHGKTKGVIKPALKKTAANIKEHPFFGMHRNPDQSVADEVESLRKPRYDL
ncbi:MAG: type II toxin-antitoxin system Phd/YefM family antitoxin [Verrucomicrobia bacterium]|nr:type II toxin-antitoxin system Phd/YefM family antitoxin [Verrucomicrobiota bacterium]